MSDLSCDQSLEFLRRVLLLRRFEEALIKLSQTCFFGHFHVYIGQETTGVPALAPLVPGDYAFTTHRNHGHLLARGADPGRLLAEIMGKATGYNKGKGGTLHVSVSELGFPTTSGIVGSVVPLATGAALAIKQGRKPNMSLCLFGDGALEEGAFFESVNMAALWRLPVVYLCENNSLGALGATAGEYPSSTNAAAELYNLVTPFGVPSSWVDGSDLVAVHRTVSEAFERARRGDGPSFIEARTVRWPGSRPLWPELVTGETDIEIAWDRTRLPAEYQAWHSEQDGLLRFVSHLIQDGVATPQAVLATDAQIKGDMENAVRFALDSPQPDPSTAFEGVFA